MMMNIASFSGTSPTRRFRSFRAGRRRVWFRLWRGLSAPRNDRSALSLRWCASCELRLLTRAMAPDVSGRRGPSSVRRPQE